MSFGMHKKNILNVDRAIKIERVGVSYRLTDTDMVGTLERDMTIVEHIGFFKDNGIKLPMIRKDVNVFFLEVEYGVVGFYVMIPVNESEYENHVNAFVDGYGK